MSMYSVPRRRRLCVDGAHDVAAGQPAIVGAGARLTAHLGNDHRVLATGTQRGTQQPLRLAVGVDIGGVEEVDPRIQGAGDDRADAGLIHLADHLPEAHATKAHRAEGKFGYEEAGPPILVVAHGIPLEVLSP